MKNKSIPSITTVDMAPYAGSETIAAALRGEPVPKTEAMYVLCHIGFLLEEAQHLLEQRDLPVTYENRLIWRNRFNCWMDFKSFYETLSADGQVAIDALIEAVGRGRR